MNASEAGHTTWEAIFSSQYEPSGSGGWVEVGWKDDSACSPPYPRVFYGANSLVANGLPGSPGVVFWCFPYSNPTGDNDYSYEFDGNPRTYYWCFRMGGPATGRQNLGFSGVNYLHVFGATDYTYDPPEMGGLSAGSAIYLSNIKSKPSSTSSPSQWNYVTTSGSPWVECEWANTGLTGCPYSYNYGFAASVLYVYNWTTGNPI